MPGEEQVNTGEVRSARTSGVQVELGRVLGAGAGERPGREVEMLENAGGDDDAEDAPPGRPARAA